MSDATSTEIREPMMLVVSIICEGCGVEHGIEEFSPKVWRWQPMAAEQLKDDLSNPKWCDDCGKRTLARASTVSWRSPTEASNE